MCLRDWVSTLGLAEAERGGERPDRRGRWRRRAALREPDVPGDAEAGERGDLLAAQAGRAPAQLGKAAVGRREPFATRAQEVSERVLRGSSQYQDDTRSGWTWPAALRTEHEGSHPRSARSTAADHRPPGTSGGAIGRERAVGPDTTSL